MGIKLFLDLETLLSFLDFSIICITSHIVDISRPTDQIIYNAFTLRVCKLTLNIEINIEKIDIDIDIEKVINVLIFTIDIDIVLNSMFKSQ